VPKLLQVVLLTEQVARIPILNNSMMNIKVATVDGFQGSECDIVILSCVRSHSHGKRGKIECFFFIMHRIKPRT
jgi:hypothetical protein